MRCTTRLRKHLLHQSETKPKSAGSTILNAIPTAGETFSCYFAGAKIELAGGNTWGWTAVRGSSNAAQQRADPMPVSRRILWHERNIFRAGYLGMISIHTFTPIMNRRVDAAPSGSLSGTPTAQERRTRRRHESEMLALLKRAGVCRCPHFQKHLSQLKRPSSCNITPQGRESPTRRGAIDSRIGPAEPGHQHQHQFAARPGADHGVRVSQYVAGE